MDTHAITRYVRKRLLEQATLAVFERIRNLVCLQRDLPLSGIMGIRK